MDISVVVASRPNRPPEQDLLTAVAADRLGYGEVWRFSASSSMINAQVCASSLASRFFLASLAQFVA